MLTALFCALAIGGQPAGNGLNWIDDKLFPKSMQEKALAATLRLTNPDTRGEATAVRVKNIGPWIYYLTAAHNVEKSKEVNLEAFLPASFPKVERKFEAKVMKVWPDIDLALLR